MKINFLLFYQNMENSVQSGAKEHLKRLPCPISAIKFTSNSTAIKVHTRRGQ